MQKLKDEVCQGSGKKRQPPWGAPSPGRRLPSFISLVLERTVATLRGQQGGGSLGKGCHFSEEAERTSRTRATNWTQRVAPAFA